MEIRFRAHVFKDAKQKMDLNEIKIIITLLLLFDMFKCYWKMNRRALETVSLKLFFLNIMFSL